MKRTWKALLTLSMVAATALVVLGTQPAQAVAVAAFPGAEGFGTETTHGRGGQIIEVTNLNDSGAGSLRAALTTSGPRIVVFRVSGNITLNTRIDVTSGSLYVAGQTAPGGGITIRNNPSNAKGVMLISAPDVLIRHVRFRPGKATSPGGSHDALTIYKTGAQRVVIDHASLSWSSDEVLNTYDDSHNLTISNSIITEGLNDDEHSKGVLLGGSGASNVSFHHNLVSSHMDRCPQISGLAVADVRNNVLYNCGGESGNGTTLLSSSKGIARVNWVNNFYKRGPATPSGENDFATYNGDTGMTQQWYGSGNKRDYTGTVQDAVVWSGSWGSVSTPFSAPPVTTLSAVEARDYVLANAGANVPYRDAVDQRAVSDFNNRTGLIISDQATVGGYPTLPSTAAPTDTDHDGMPDAWESARGLNPSSNDSAADRNSDGWTNVEEYLSELAGDTGTTPPPPTNAAPGVSSGSDQSVVRPAAVNLDGTVSDDGLPSGTLTQTWSQVSGPGVTSFGDANSVDTTATFSAAGTYVLRLTASDGALSNSDDVTVVATDAPPTVIQTPTMNRASTDCGVASINYAIDQDDTDPSDFEFLVDGVLWDSDQLSPPSNIESTWTDLLAEDSSGGSADVVGKANGNTLVTFSVNTNCVQPPSGVTYVSSTYAHSASGSVLVALPVGSEVGDKVVFQVVENKGTGGAITAPAGVVPLGTELSDGSSLGARLYVYTVPEFPVASFTFSGSFSQMEVTAMMYRGVTTVTQVAHVAETGSDAAHPVSGTTGAAGVNLVFGADRKYASGAVPSTWTLGAGLTERREGAGPKSGSAFSQVAGDSGVVPAGAKTYAVTASQSSGYAITALVLIS